MVKLCILILKEVRMMKNFFTYMLISIVLSIGAIQTVSAHPGRTDANGGHWDRSAGTYHYHNGGSSGNSGGISSYTPSPSYTPTHSYKIKTKPSSIKMGKSYKLEVDNGSSTTYYSSSNKNVATIDSKGNITAVGVGTTTIKAKTGSTTDSFKLTVQPIKAKTISIGKSFNLNVGDYKNLKATISPKKTTDKTVTYKSSNNKIAVVDINGKVTGKAKGKATITATTSNKKSAKIIVTVKEVMPKTLKFDSDSTRFEMKDNKLINALNYQMTPDNVTNKEVEFTSSDESILSVSKDGEEITLLKEGEATITVTAKANKISDTIKVEVFAIHPENIAITEEQLGITNLFGKKFIKPNTIAPISATIEPSDSTFQDVLWESDNPSAIEIDTSSEVPFIKVHSMGSATINAYVDSVSSELMLVVLDIQLIITFSIIGFVVVILGVLCIVFRTKINILVMKIKSKTNI